MRIRLAQDKDYAAIAHLHRATIRHINSKDYPEDIISVWSGRTKANRFRNSESKVKRWVAVEDEKITGFCDHEKTECEIGGLYVHKDYQSKGIGKKLLEKAESSLKKMGCKKIKIMSTISAKNFYQRNGYKIIKKGLHMVENKKLKIFILSKTIK